MRATLISGVRIDATVLYGNTTVSCRHIQRPTVVASLLNPVRREDAESNFITADGMYLITADGKVFYIID